MQLQQCATRKELAAQVSGAFNNQIYFLETTLSLITSHIHHILRSLSKLTLHFEERHPRLL